MKKIILVLLFIITYSFAITLEDGKLAYDNQDYKKAFKIYEELASNGNANAQYALGLMHAKGNGVIQDYKKAVYWYEKAAIQGILEAKYMLSFVYRHVDGEGDINKATKWLIEAAKNGHHEALYDIGTYYYGYYYNSYINKDGKEDYIKAFEYFREAARRGNKDAEREILKLEEKDINWHIKAANQGLPESQNILGVAYVAGKVIPEDNEKAFYWFIKSAKGGSDQALYNIGAMYYNGYGTKQDYVKAFEYYRKAASHGNKDAQNEILNIKEKDINWHIKAANQGLPESQNILGVMYLQGNMVNQDYGKAFELFEKASIKGEAYASLNLGLMYLGGKGTNKDTKKAKKYFKKACDGGIKKACEYFSIVW